MPVSWGGGAEDREAPMPWDVAALVLTTHPTRNLTPEQLPEPEPRNARRDYRRRVSAWRCRGGWC